MNKKSIRRNLVLKELDIKESPDGTQKTFSVRFITQEGESVFIPVAVSCGVAGDMKANRMRGFQSVDDDLEPIGHPYPVLIDNIVEYENKTVIL